jgi:hypothetical protein
MVCREPPCPFRSLSAAFFAKLCSKKKSIYKTALSLSAADEVGAWPNFVRKKGCFRNFRTRFSKTIEKIPIGILSTRAITKPSSSFFFHFQNQIMENLVSKPREKRIGGGLFEYFYPTISIRKASE